MSSRGERLEKRNDRQESQRQALKEKQLLEWNKNRRKDSSRKQTQIRAQKKEAARERRERIRNDPDKYEAQKAAERARWLKRVQEGKVKTVNMMSSREKRIHKKRRRISDQKYKAKKRATESQQSNPESQETNPIPVGNTAVELGDVPVNESISVPENVEICDFKGSSRTGAALKKCKSSIKRLKSERAQVLRENADLKAKNKTIQRSLWRTRKQLQKVKTVKLTPNSKVNRIIRGKKISPEVKKKLLFGEVLSTQLQHSLGRVKSVRVKQVAHRLVSGSILKRYKMMKFCKPFLSLTLLRKYRQEKELASLKIDRAESNQKLTRIEKIHNFFCREDVSSECPDKNAFETKFGKNRVKMRRRFLKASLKDLYKLYCETEVKPVSYTVFCNFKPFYVVKRDLSDRNTCLCEKCENMQLLISTLNRAKALSEVSGYAVIRSLCCLERTEECMNRSCQKCIMKTVQFLPCDDDDVVKRQKWVTIQEERKIRKKKSVHEQGHQVEVNNNNRKNSTNRKKNGSRKTKSKSPERTAEDMYEIKIVKRTVRQSFEMTLGQLKKEMSSEIDKYMSHVYRDFHQLGELRKKRENLDSSDLYLWMDFSENYQCKYGREVQSHYYGASREEVKLHTGVAYLKGEKQAFCSLSKCLRSDPQAILAHMLPVTDKFITPGISRLHLQSDSPVTQYRNKTMFYLITTEIPKRYPQITEIIFNYTEAGHGKGAPDGVGGRAKSLADQIVAADGDVDTFEKMVNVLQEKCPNILILTVTEENISEIDKLVPSSLETFQGTMLVHQFTWCKEHKHTIYFNSVSCYSCLPGTKCSHFNLPNSPYSTGKESVSGIDPDDPGPPVLETIKRGNWVAVKFGNHWYPGLVERVQGSKFSVNFLVKHEKKNDQYLWPPKPDIQSVNIKDVVFKLTQPPQPVDRQHFSIPDHDIIDSIVAI